MRSERLLQSGDILKREPERFVSTLRCTVEVPSSYLPRAQYTIQTLFEPLGIDIEWVSLEVVARHGGIYYGPRIKDNSFHVLKLTYSPDAPSFFDSRRPYDPEQIRRVEWEGETWPALFADREGDPDLVASAFFWLSGWQEFTARRYDQHGRSGFETSLLAICGSITRPVVDAYREMIAERLQVHGLSFRRRTWGGRDWVLCPTHDIDYLRKWRPGMVYREVVQYFLMNHQGVGMADRFRRLGKVSRDWLRKGDLYRESLERIREEESRRGGTATFFFKAGAHGPHDVSYSLLSKYVTEQIKTLEEGGFEIGLHPSYHAHNHPGYLIEERDELERILSSPLESVRQHYLRFDPVSTPVIHGSAGFRIDSTLGFAESEGFRRGTCLPFRLYDLVEDRALDVWEMPLAIMESALFSRKGLDTDEAVTATVKILETCRRFRGACVVLWHNVLWDELDFPGWGSHFTRVLDLARDMGGGIVSLRDALRSWH